jgi:hypothetical protein
MSANLTEKKLNRDEFRKQVFQRDNHKCVVCSAPAVDAHHIIDRSLWADQGFYLNNGASLCEPCHLKAEQTLISCSTLRELCGIKEILLPAHLEPGDYDKWANPILPNGNRFCGELFDKPSVQKILQPILHLFVARAKYPRTPHFPWSPGKTKDDTTIESFDGFIGKEVVATVKMDGECSTLYCDYLHARSTDYSPHPSRTWLKSFHAKIAHEIPKGWRICGENVYAKHSIKYTNLESYFLVFSIWNEHNVCLSWNDTLEWCKLLDLKTVPVLYVGQWDEKIVSNLYNPIYDGNDCEGFVVRISDLFAYKDFRKIVCKYVRQGHVTTDKHWKNSQIEPNELKNV